MAIIWFNCSHADADTSSGTRLQGCPFALRARQSRLQYSQADIVKIAGNGGGTQALESMLEHAPALTPCRSATARLVDPTCRRPVTCVSATASELPATG
ncbi:hypothetical protein IHE31_02075 (plasmid) [Mycetohabitans rhizoxinica]|uniref:Uncharacterized protein n=1 Tax=Mycetohabitans rhizoxinica TaxID=412963 RepID=A0ABZ2PVH8_9BURK